MENENLERKIKKFAIYGGVVLTAGLAALGVNKLGSKKNNETQVQTQITTEAPATTEYVETTEEGSSYTGEGLDVSNPESVEMVIEESYNNYQDYYDSEGVTIDDLRNVVLVINDQLDGLTQDDIDDSCELIGHMFISDNLTEKLDNINAEKGGMQTASDCNIMQVPLVSSFVSYENENIVPMIERIEADRDLVISTVQSDDYGKDLVNKINKEIINMEYNDFDSSMGLDNSETKNEGSCYVIASAKNALCQLGILVNPTKHFITADNGDKIQISRTNEEADLVNQMMTIMSSGLQPSDELQLKYADNESKLVATKYQEDMCNYQAQLKNNVNSNTKNYSLD